MSRLPGWVSAVAEWPPVAHHVASVRRANALRYTRWAAAIALFGYLSLFPLATLAFVVFSVTLSRTPELQEQVQSAVADALPGLLGTDSGVVVDLSQTAQATLSAGIVGVVALLFAGLGWVDATIEGTRRMLGVMRRPRNFVLLRFENAGWLVLLGGILLLALVASVGVRALGTRLLDAVADEEASTVWLHWFGDIVAVVLVGVTLLLLYGYAWHRPGRRWAAVVTAAVTGALVLEAMSLGIYLLVGRTLDNPVYGTLAVAAALLLFLYFASVVVLYGACWVAVREGRPETTEEQAYYARGSEADPLLP
jgi:membrane protein